MKAANAQKLNNKEKPSSFMAFLKQKKSLGGNKIQQSIEIKEPKRSKDTSKILQKNNTNFLPETQKINVAQSVIISKNRY